MSYQIIELYDEKGRMIDVPKFYQATNPDMIGTYQSHGFSTLYAQIFVSDGDVPFPGLEKIVMGGK